MRTDWMAAARYGLITHYLYGWNDLQGDWNSITEGFSPQRFAADCAAACADYVIFTLGQGRGVYAAPNAYYDRLLNQAGLPNRSPERDIVREIIDALKTYRIRTMLYFVADPSWDDRESRLVLTGSDDTAPNAQMALHTIRMAREWSLRYGKDVCGWWIDGFGGVNFSEEEKRAFADALRAGNGDAVLAFNGNDLQFRKMGDYEDYTAGETFHIGPVPQDRFLDGLQWHAITYLGKDWGDGSIRYSSAQLAGWIAQVNRRQGVCTLDIQVLADGHLSPLQVAQLQEVSNLL